MTELNQIYNEYFYDVYRYILALCKNQAVAEDITQETFFKVLKSIDSFKGDCSLYSWLCQIAKNTYFSYLKKQKPKVEEDLTYERELYESIEDKEAVFNIHKALHTLKEPYKEVFHLRIFGELSFLQIAQIFGKTESWARVTYHRARIKLKEKML